MFINIKSNDDLFYAINLLKIINNKNKADLLKDIENYFVNNSYKYFKNINK